LATAALDIAKGAIAVLFAMFFVDPSTFGNTTQQWAMIAASGFAVLGHSFSPYLRFQGGKGVATLAGGLFVIAPLATTLLVALWILLLVTTRLMSLASVLSVCAAPFVCAIVNRGHWPLIAYAVVGAVIVVWRHRTNIQRLAKGQESRISLKDAGETLRKKGSSS
jgi:acyl phosphate:glycerol-3-phosphate acyltransferase